MKGNQLKALELLVSGEYKSYEEIARQLKITPKTLYNWRREEEFAAEFERRMRIKIGGIAPRALRKMEKLIDAKSEMVSQIAAKDILDRAGYTAENVIKFENNIPVQIIDDIPEGDINAETD